jgi:hypothetical protein
MKRILILIFIFIFSSNLYADNTAFDFIKKASVTDKEEFDRSKELYSENESTLTVVDEDLGLVEDPHYTGDENTQLIFSFHISSDILKLSEVMTFEGQYSFKLDDFQDSWVSFLIKQTSANYDALANEMLGSQSNNPDANFNITRASNVQTITTFGLGLGHRFKLLTKNSDRFFEKVSAFATFNLSTDSTNDDQYSGVGFISEYSLYYRSAKSFFYGTKISYNLMPLVRQAKGSEQLADRSLVFGHTSLALELGYFY